MTLLDSKIKSIDMYLETSKFEPTYKSLSEYEIPKWFKNYKFGLFSHFGPYTVPEYGHDWYVRSMYTKGEDINNHHVKTYGPLTEYGYKYLIDNFNPTKFNSDEWLRIIKNSGAKYYVPVAEHHDGFQMYGSEISEFNSVAMKPNIDFISELKKSCEKNEIYFGLSSHRAEHFFFLDEGRKHETDIVNPKYGDLYWPSLPKTDINLENDMTELFLKDWFVRSCELVDLFLPKVFYFDWWIEQKPFKPYVQKFLAYYYSKTYEKYGYCGVVNYKHDGIPYTLAVRDIERGQLRNLSYDYWQGCTAISKHSWIYTLNNSYKTSDEIIKILIDTVSKNGNMLLNFGPKADGSICKEEIKVLTEIGDFLRVNGEAIFDTHPYKIYGEGPTNVSGGDFTEQSLSYTINDFRFTAKENNLYMFIMNACEKNLKVKSLGLKNKTLKKNVYIKNVTLLNGDNVTCERMDEYMEIVLEKKYNNVVVVKFEME